MDPTPDPSPPIRVLCADDHPLVRKGIASILNQEADVRLVAEAGNGREAAERLTEYFPQPALSPREVEVLSLVARGLSNKEIAAQLGTAAGTIKIHVQNILAKLGASDRTHAVTIAVQRGIFRL